MAKYKLLVNGYGLDGSAHTLTDQEVQAILSFKEKEGHKTLDEMYKVVKRKTDSLKSD